ncbi:hypothetical protein [Clostridium sp.]|uniref:hypothetical protein n=1 Tax=Clostridium sp. TaxID=1506 RepID=UPI002638E348|nr:hypothetical protein [Clostridium sp.]
MKSIKKNSMFIGFGIMMIIVIISGAGYSNKNDTIQVKNYFPIDKPITYELEGTFNDMENAEIRKMTAQVEREGKSKVAGIDVYVEKQIYFDESKNKDFECETYSNYDKDGNIVEFGKKVNDKLTWNNKPAIFLQNANIGNIYGGTDKTILASNEGDNNGNKATIELKGLIDLNIDDKVYKDCLFVEKNFYDGKDIVRKEQLYLQKGFGLIKYVEESFKESYKFEISYKGK